MSVWQCVLRVLPFPQRFAVGEVALRIRYTLQPRKLTAISHLVKICSKEAIAHAHPSSSTQVSSFVDSS